MKQKGAALRSTLQAIANLHGDDALERLKAALRPDLRALIEPRILQVGWYPIEVSAAVHVLIREQLGNGQWDMSHLIGVEAAKIDFNGIYRVFLRSMQYDTLWDRAQRAWDNYNSQGQAKWGERAGGTTQGVVTGVTGFNRGVWNAVAGRFESLILLSGARAANVEVVEPSATGCKFNALWLE